MNTAHPRPWGWRVTTYLWTKAVAAGALAVAGLAHILGIDLGWLGDYAAPAVAMAGAALTGVLLIWDLKRPERFLYIFLRSNWSSWLVWGAYALAAFGGVAALWVLAAFLGSAWGATVLAWAALVSGALVAGYTGFLFGQAEGRDLWQSPLLFWHLLVQAAMVGTGALLVVAPFAGLSDGAVGFLVRVFVLSTGLHLLMLLIEYSGRHASRQATLAAHIITRGRYARLFWLGAIVPAVVAAALAAPSWNGSAGAALLVAAGLLTQISLLAYETAFVRAGQDPPLS
nr:NrfD/PsrC family molybdoenzyme membrane anchor subunit [Rhodococcus aetherivorans]